MRKIILENTFIELEVQSNSSEHANEGLVSIDGTQWCALQEANVYDYRIQFKENSHNDEKLWLELKGGSKGVIKPNSLHPNSGAIHTNTYVGNLFFEIYRGSESESVDERELIDEFYLKVHSVKVNYEKEYQYMLEEITATCADLLLRASSSVYQFLTVDEDSSSTSDYQRFKFVESLVLSESFDNALSQILYSIKKALNK